jgi:hypothetical protein
MRLVILLSAFGMLSACAKPPNYHWESSRGPVDQQTFARDRYDCLQQSQQTRSSAVVDGFGGVANSSVVTNGPLFIACMEAKGYSNVPDVPQKK